MNRNFLIAIVIAAAAVIAYFILSSPSEADKAAAGATGLPGDGNLGTGAAPSGSSGNPLADLIKSFDTVGSSSSGNSSGNEYIDRLKANVGNGVEASKPSRQKLTDMGFWQSGLGFNSTFGNAFMYVNDNSGIPRAFLIDATGEIVNPGTAKYDNLLSQLKAIYGIK